LEGVRVGGAGISVQHANFIVNEGSATAKDILSLVGLIKDKVKEKFGVSLELEALVVGEE
jgi:UDP-N-acetylmuramate dehydrogenase